MSSNRDTIVLFIRLKFNFRFYQCPAPLWVLSLIHKLAVDSKGILKKMPPGNSVIKICSFPFMKLLIIEDEKELAASIASYLKNENYTCEIASNFKQALDKIETSDYECIALDITLPGGSGMQLLKELKNNKNRWCHHYFS